MWLILVKMRVMLYRRVFPFGLYSATSKLLLWDLLCKKNRSTFLL